MAFTSDKWIRMRNNNALKAINAAGNGTVDMIKVDGSDVLQLLGTVQYSGSEVANKSYVSAMLNGMKPKAAVAAATAAAIADLGASSADIDGQALVNGARYLIKNQASAPQNGIYTWATGGVFTRATDFDSLSPIDEINGAFTAVQAGTANAGKVFVVSSTVTEVGVSDINFVFYNNADISHSNRTALDAVSGTNTGDETQSTIKTKLGAAATGADGYLTSTDWNTFNGKEAGGAAASAISAHNSAYTHGDIAHTNRSALDSVSGSNTGDETQSTIKTKLGAAATGADGYLTSTDWNTFNGKQAALGFTAEDSANKSTDGTLGDNSTTKYPSQSAVVTYVAAQISSAAVPVAAQEIITLIADDISAGYKDLAHVIKAGSLSLCPVGGPKQTAAVDYTLSTVSSKTRITFAADLLLLVAGDKLDASYLY